MSKTLISILCVVSVSAVAVACSSTKEDPHDPPMTRQQAGDRMRKIMGNPEGTDPAARNPGKGMIRPMSSSGGDGDGYCGGYKLCQADSECADQPDGQKQCCDCPACGKHCYSCGGSSSSGSPPPPPPPGIDAGSCEAGEPTYPAPNNTDSGRQAFGFDLPDPAASWVCGQLALIPYVGQVLFTPTGGLGFQADAQVTTTDEWASTCRHTTGRSTGAGINVNICGLGAEGRFDDKRTTVNQSCLDCGPPPTCGAVVCSDANHTLTRQASVTKTFPVGFGGNPSACDTSAAPSSRWMDWIKRSMNLSVTVGGGWNGNTSDLVRTPGPGTCATCTPCETHADRNSVFLQVGGNASMSTPSWGGLSGSAFINLTGRIGAGREDQTSTCSTACGGFNANASITLRMGISIGAFGFSVAQSVGYTCRWAKSWSDCPGAGAEDISECGWASSTDP